MAEQTNPATEVSSPAAIEGKLFEMFSGKPAEDKVEAPNPQTEQAQDTPADAPEGDAQVDELTPDDLPDDEAPQAQPPEGELEIVHNGKKLKVSRDEAIKLVQQGFDYTAKTQELAEERKQVAAMLQSATDIRKMQDALADDVATLKSYERALKPFEGVDWVQLATNEPLEYSRIRAQYDQLLHAANTAFGQYQAKANGISKQQAELTQQVLRQERSKMLEKVPAWSDAAKFQKDAAAIRQYLVSEGVTPEEVDGLTSAVAVTVAYKAMQYDRLVKSKSERNKQVRSAPPVLKPGTATTRTEQSRAEFGEMKSQLAKAAKANNTKAQEQLVTKMLQRTFQTKR